MAEKVRFIRVKGRVIPIKNAKKRKRIEGAGLIASGGAISASGAFVSGKFAKKSKSIRSEFFKNLKKTPQQLDLFTSPKFPHGKSQTRRIAAKRAIASRSIFKNTSLLTSALVGLGVTKFVSSFDDNKKDNSAASQLVGTGAFAVTESIQRNVFSKVSKGTSFKSSFGADFKKVAKTLSPRKVVKAFKVFF